MAQENGSKSISHLQNLFNQRSPKTKYFSQSRVQQFNDSIAKQIVNGDTVVSSNRDDSAGKPKNRYEQQKRRHQLTQAQQQKQQLQRKLSYVNHSIDSIKKYSYLKAEHQSIPTKSRQKDPQQAERLKEKDRQLIQSVKKHKQKLQKIRLQQQQRKKLIREQQIQSQRKAEQELKQSRKKQILKNMKKIKKKMEERESENKRSTEKVKQIINKKQLFHKMEDNYKERQLLTLEQRKRKLSEIRNFHKPIDINELRQHEKKVEEMRKEKEDIRLRQKKINQSTINYKAPYIGSYYREVLEKKTDDNDSLASSKIKVDKIKQFAEHIRQNFVPQVDKRKKKELEQFIEKEALDRSLKQQKSFQKIQLRKLKGAEYMQHLRKIPKNRNASKVEEQGSRTARTVYKNYLSHSTDEGSPHKTEHTWTKILTKKQLNKKQKARLLQYESQRMQEYLKRRQQQSRLLKKNNQEDIDNEYYNMIKAKLSLLTNQS